MTEYDNIVVAQGTLQNMLVLLYILLPTEKMADALSEERLALCLL
jgi:hypothetical protein